MMIQLLTLILISCLVWKPTVSGSQSAVTNKTLEKEIWGLAAKLGSLMFKSYPNENVFFSPLSVYTTLAMLHQGADGRTKDELTQALGIQLTNTSDVDTLHTTLGTLIKSLQASEEVNVSTANGLYVKNYVHLKSDFQEQVKVNYDGRVTALNFSYSGSTDYVNNWISYKTKGRIPKLFTTNLEEDTEMILVNIFYFEAQWETRFSERLTDVNSTFTIAADKQIQIDLMTDRKSVPYLDNENKKYRAMGLPYKDQAFTMFFILPYENVSLSSLMEDFKGEDLQFMVNATTANIKYVRYRIPRTKFSWKNDIDGCLANLGVKTIFEKPDFSKMLSGSVKVSKMTHATDLQIDENGTTAAAVTTAQLTTRTGSPRDMITFEVTKPFLLTIYHQGTKTVLFYGAVYNPLGR